MTGHENECFMVESSRKKTFGISVDLLRNCGFGLGLGNWKKSHLTALVRGVAELKINLNAAIYSGGILGYLNNIVKKPLCQINARLHFFLYGQYQVLKKEYNIVKYALT